MIVFKSLQLNTMLFVYNVYNLESLNDSLESCVVTPVVVLVVFRTTVSKCFFLYSDDVLYHI